MMCQPCWFQSNLAVPIIKKSQKNGTPKRDTRGPRKLSRKSVPIIEAVKGNRDAKIPRKPAQILDLSLLSRLSRFLFIYVYGRIIS